jgi:hypothetical protein
MKRAVSISLGSSKRDKSVVIKLKDQEILVERKLILHDFKQAGFTLPESLLSFREKIRTH